MHQATQDFAPFPTKSYAEEILCDIFFAVWHATSWVVGQPSSWWGWSTICITDRALVAFDIFWARLLGPHPGTPNGDDQEVTFPPPRPPIPNLWCCCLLVGGFAGNNPDNKLDDGRTNNTKGDDEDKKSSWSGWWWQWWYWKCLRTMMRMMMMMTMTMTMTMVVVVLILLMVLLTGMPVTNVEVCFWHSATPSLAANTPWTVTVFCCIVDVAARFSQIFVGENIRRQFFLGTSQTIPPYISRKSTSLQFLAGSSKAMRGLAPTVMAARFFFLNDKKHIEDNLRPKTCFNRCAWRLGGSVAWRWFSST